MANENGRNQTGQHTKNAKSEKRIVRRIHTLFRDWDVKVMSYVMLVVTAIALIASTVAWFTYFRYNYVKDGKLQTADCDSLKIAIEAGGADIDTLREDPNDPRSIKISLNMPVFKYVESYTETTQAGSGSTPTRDTVRVDSGQHATEVSVEESADRAERDTVRVDSGLHATEVSVEESANRTERNTVRTASGQPATEESVTDTGEVPSVWNAAETAIEDSEESDTRQQDGTTTEELEETEFDRLEHSMVIPFVHTIPVGVDISEVVPVTVSVPDTTEETVAEAPVAVLAENPSAVHSTEQAVATGSNGLTQEAEGDSMADESALTGGDTTSGTENPATDDGEETEASAGADVVRYDPTTPASETTEVKSKLAPGVYGRLKLYLTPLNVQINRFRITPTILLTYSDGYRDVMTTDTADWSVKLVDASGAEVPEEDERTRRVGGAEYNPQIVALRKLVQGHILFFEETKTENPDGSVEYQHTPLVKLEDGSYALSSLEGNLTFDEEKHSGKEKEVTIYWCWVYEYNDLPDEIKEHIDENASVYEPYFFDDTSDEDEKSQRYDYADTKIGTCVKSMQIHLKVDGYHHGQTVPPSGGD